MNKIKRACVFLCCSVGQLKVEGLSLRASLVWPIQKLQFVSLPHWLHFSGLEASAVKAKLEHEMYRLTFDPSVPFALLSRQVN